MHATGRLVALRAIDRVRLGTLTQRIAGILTAGLLLLGSGSSLAEGGLHWWRDADGRWHREGPDPESAKQASPGAAVNVDRKQDRVKGGDGVRWVEPRPHPPHYYAKPLYRGKHRRHTGSPVYMREPPVNLVVPLR